MLDIKYIVENKDKVEKALLKRMDPDELNLDAVIDLYKEYKSALVAFEDAKAEQNKHSEEVARLEKSSKEFKLAIEEMKGEAQKVRELERKMGEAHSKYVSVLDMLPNIPDEDVVAGCEENKEVLRVVGDGKKFDFEPKDHLTIGANLGILDFDRAAKVSCSHFPMYVGDGVLLEWALIQYFIKKHAADGYTGVIPPFMVNRRSAYVTGQLPKFEGDVYWTLDGMCLVPTAETALTNMHNDEIFNESDLPKKYYAYTPCFRRECGTYGARDRGLMRIHQFNKVELYQLTTQENSDEAFEEMLKKAEELLKELGLRYRIAKLAGGELSFGMARTYDPEVWLPKDNIWTEAGSTSNAREFQARRGNIKYRATDGKIKYVHTLNGSGLATSRVMVAILETYQQKDGSVVVPEVLREFIGKDVIKKQ